MNHFMNKDDIAYGAAVRKFEFKTVAEILPRLGNPQQCDIFPPSVIR